MITERQRRAFKWGGLLLAAAFVAVVVVTAAVTSTPTGMSSMAMTSTPSRAVGRVDVAIRDIAGRRHELPGHRAGAVVFIEAHNCPVCIQAVAALAAAQRRSGSPVGLLAISLQADDARPDVAGFLRAARETTVPVAVDTRMADLARYFGGPSPGSAIVFNSRGAVTARLDAPTQATADAALARAVRLK